MKTILCLVWILVNVVTSSSLYGRDLNNSYQVSNNPVSNHHNNIQREQEYIPQKDVERHRRFIPFARPTTKTINTSEECSSSSDDFPPFFTEAQLRQGAVIIAFLVGVYCFTLLAIVCDTYFLPCVEKICEALNLSQDVAAATFMSAATSAPELFVNIIGTFITESDIGIGTIVGSSLFNTLGVASLGGLAAAQPIKLHWWPLTRDVIIYILAILLLVAITWDNLIFWYEALILFIVYFMYLTVMFQNVRISDFIKKVIKKCRRKNKVDDSSKSPDNLKSSPSTNNINNLNVNKLKEDRVSVSIISAYGSYMEDPRNIQDGKEMSEAEKEEFSLFSWPTGVWWKKAFFYYSWPIRFVLFCTVPDPQKYPKMFPFTFIMCVCWIGSNSYIVSWMITVAGNLFQIPDAVLGLTFLAAGGCLPEAISITIMSRRGEGSMGVSNSLGANTMNILLSLGMPWFMKTILMGTDNNSFIEIRSGSIEYTILALILVACILYTTLYLNKFKLRRRVGAILMCVYFFCIVLAILSEMLFFKSADCS